MRTLVRRPWTEGVTETPKRSAVIYDTGTIVSSSLQQFRAQVMPEDRNQPEVDGAAGGFERCFDDGEYASIWASSFLYKFIAVLHN